MSEWISCGGDFLPADVVRWTEAIWERPGMGKRKPRKTGSRLVTAELLRDVDADGWVRLLVRACIVTEDKSDGRRATALAVGEEITRKRDTLEKGWPVRLPWSDESARTALVAERAERPRPPSVPKKKRQAQARARKGRKR